MMSSTQKALLYANIPTNIYNYTLQKSLRSRFTMSPITYPAITVSFLSEGIKKHWNTWAPVATVLNETTQDYDKYYGSQDVANISLTVWSKDEDELRQICHGLEMYIRVAGLDFYWPNDHIKVTGIKSVQLLEPYADEFIQEHTWRAVIDFSVEYLWTIIDVGSGIKSFEYLFTNESELDAMQSYSFGSYGMSILILGWRSTYMMDYLALKENKSSSHTMNMKVVI